ncbi:MAG: hemerythrin domain-containing protein [Acidimicrobiales bacterium]
MAHITKDLWDQHRKIEAMFGRHTKGDGAFYATVHAPTENNLLGIILHEIEIHSAIEEEIVYPMLAQVDERRAEESQQDHEDIKDLMAEIEELETGDPALTKLVKRLEKNVLAHAAREEREVFPIIKQRLYHEGFEMGRQAFALRQEMYGAGDRQSMKAPARLGWPGNGWG